VQVNATEVGSDASDIGNAGCYVSGGSTWCAIAYVNAANCPAWIEGHPLANGTFSVTENNAYCGSGIGTLRHHAGHLSFAADTRAVGSLGFIGTLNYHQVDATYTYRVARGGAISGNPILLSLLGWDESRPAATGIMTRNLNPQLKIMRIWAEPASLF
jgi:hypothetical protein